MAGAQCIPGYVCLAEMDHTAPNGAATFSFVGQATLDRRLCAGLNVVPRSLCKALARLYHSRIRTIENRTQKAPPLRWDLPRVPVVWEGRFYGNTQ